MEAVKIYGLCMERLRHQIAIAIRHAAEKDCMPGVVILEGYNTGELEDIVDILELYDLEERTPGALREKLDDLAYTASVLTQQRLFFDFNDRGHLALCLALRDRETPHALDLAMAHHEI